MSRGIVREEKTAVRGLRAESSYARQGMIDPIRQARDW